MKQMILAFAVMLSIFNVHGFELVEEGIQADSSILETFAPGHSYLEGVDYGSVMVHHTDNVVVLTLVKPQVCGPGLFCAAVMPAPIEIRLPLIAVSSDGCGVVQYVAQKDQTMVDGPLQVLTVSDFSNVSCRMATPAMTTVEYKTMNPWLQEWTYSHFTGDALEALPVPMY